ncbi:MAG: spore coat protein [Clostridia bacterium]|nr:spore coat protein [Clostridia bacterium]
MTTKELLYIEDALGHEKYFQTQCKHAMSELKDPQLRSFVEQMAKNHEKLFGSFYELL